jgi:SAM-dependent methyltransferase
MKYYLNGRVATYDKSTKTFYICEEKEGFDLKNYGGKGRPGERTSYYFDTFAALRERSYDLAIENIKRLTLGKRISVLDIGCSYGVFLKKALDQGWNAMGIEPSQNEAAFAREIFKAEVSETIIEGFESDQRWDVITLWDVFEHLPQPTEKLGIVKSLLADDGIVIIRVPNANGFIHRLAFIIYMVTFGYINFPLVKLFENHLYIYTECSLKETLEKAGLNVILSYGEGMIDPDINVIRKKSYVACLPKLLQEPTSIVLALMLNFSCNVSMKDSLVVYCRQKR